MYPARRHQTASAGGDGTRYVVLTRGVIPSVLPVDRAGARSSGPAIVELEILINQSAPRTGIVHHLQSVVEIPIVKCTVNLTQFQAAGTLDRKFKVQSLFLRRWTLICWCYGIYLLQLDRHWFTWNLCKRGNYMNYIHL